MRSSFRRALNALVIAGTALLMPGMVSADECQARKEYAATQKMLDRCQETNCPALVSLEEAFRAATKRLSACDGEDPASDDDVADGQGPDDVTDTEEVRDEPADLTGQFTRTYNLSSVSHGGWTYTVPPVEPWAGLLVVATGADGRTHTGRTGRDGRFLISVPREGTYTVEVEDCDVYHDHQWSAPAPGDLGETMIVDDRRQAKWAKATSFYYFMQAVGRAPEPGTHPSVLIRYLDQVDIQSFKRYMDKTKLYRLEHERLFDLWARKRWDHISCPGQPVRGGAAALLDDIKTLKESDLGVLPNPGHTPLLKMHPDVVEWNAGGTYLSVGEGMTTFTKHTVNYNSTLLFHRGEGRIEVFVLEGSATEWSPEGDELLAAAWTDWKIVYRDDDPTPTMEPFTWDEVEAVWRDPGNAAPPSNPIVQVEAPGPGNTAPVAGFEMVPPRIEVGQSVVVLSVCSDADSDRLQRTWFVNGTHHEELDGLSEWQTDEWPEGLHTIRLVVEDGRGGRDELSKRLLIVEEGDPNEFLLFYPDGQDPRDTDGDGQPDVVIRH